MGSMQGLGHDVAGGHFAHTPSAFSHERQITPIIPRITQNVRRILVLFAAALIGCGSEDPTRPPFGEALTVAEQVAVEAAFGKVADSLDKVFATPNDSIIADFTRIAARLVRLEGLYGTITVNLPGSAAPVQMRAVAGTSSDPASSARFVLAWEDLDVATFQVKRALVMQSGGFESTLAAQLRYLDMTGSTPTFYSGGGILTFTAPSFTANCIGLKNTSSASCRAGKLTAAGQADVVPRSGGTTTSISWDPTVISAFEVILR